MVTGKNICPVCKKRYSPKHESKLWVDTGKITEITKMPILDYLCMKCYNKEIKRQVG